MSRLHFELSPLRVQVPAIIDSLFRLVSPFEPDLGSAPGGISSWETLHVDAVDAGYICHAYDGCRMSSRPAATACIPNCWCIATRSSSRMTTDSLGPVAVAEIG